MADPRIDQLIKNLARAAGIPPVSAYVHETWGRLIQQAFDAVRSEALLDAELDRAEEI